ncbi:MAG: TerB N-terminal domain-containing protein [Treponema sp.]|jgi:hypothetical protein|nr:TerB N-terminal domain-containing protein [Treponema sp.]
MTHKGPLLDGLGLSSFAVALDFTGTAFTALITRDGKLATYREIAEHPVLKRSITKKYQDSVPGLVTLAIQDAERLMTASPEVLECTFSPDAARITFKAMKEPFLDYVYDAPSASFHRKLPPNMVPLAEGYFIQGDTILKIPEDNLDDALLDILEQECIQGEAILSLAHLKTTLIRSRPVLARFGDRLMELQAKVQKSRGELLITLKRELVPQAQWLPLAGLSNHRLYGNTIYEILPEAFITAFFAEGDTLILTQENLSLFADTHAGILRRFGDKKLVNLLSEDKLYISPEQLSLVLHGISRIERGVGTAYAVPMLKYGKKCYSARLVSNLLETAKGTAVQLDSKWVRKETLRAIGLGDLGCLIDGTPLKPIRMSAAEVLNQGGDDLLGLWSEFTFVEDNWVPEADANRIFRSHIEFLRTYGISGGIIAHHNGWVAEVLAAYLGYLSQQIKNGTVILLMREKFYKDHLKKKLRFPIPVQAQQERSVFSPQFKGIGICYYEKLAAAMADKPARCDLLILVKPEELILNEQKACYEHIAAIQTRICLGIIFNATYLFQDIGDTRIKELFSIQGKLNHLVQYVFRDPNTPLALPRPYRFFCWDILKPPLPFTSADPAGTAVFGGSRFVIRSQFERSNTGEFNRERQYFTQEGPKVPAVNYIISRDADLRFSRLNQKQRDFFLYWRGAFRKHIILEVPRNYIFIYALELIMVMGDEEPLQHFEELLRLWRSYRDTYPQLDYHFPLWLRDFAVLYQIIDTALPELIPYSQDGVSNIMMRNLYLHRRYIEEDNPILGADIMDILYFDPKAGRIEKGALDWGVPVHDLEHPIETILHEVDHYLREHCGKRFFEFFYPVRAIPYLINAFTPIEHLGHGEYIAEWIDFYVHPPLRAFLEELTAYIDFKLCQKEGVQKAKEPTLDPRWKYLADTELGFPARLPEAFNTIELAQDTLDQLRQESDEVRELLRIEADEEDEHPLGQQAQKPDAEHALAESAPSVGPPDRKPPSIADFLSSLDEGSSATLKLLAERGSSGENLSAALEQLAQHYLTMPELLFDTINEQFQDVFNDLLIDTMGEAPLVSAEYEEAVKGYFGIA